MNESLPGLWEFPMWDIQDDKGVVLTNMDPQVGGWWCVCGGGRGWGGGWGG